MMMMRNIGHTLTRLITATIGSKLNSIESDLAPSLISELSGKRNAYQLLSNMYIKSKVISTSELSEMITDIGLTDSAFQKMENAGLVLSAPHGFYLSSFGTRTALLLRVINGDEDVVHAFNTLRAGEDGFGNYQLIESNITNYFVERISQKSDFIRLYVCSPWIRLEKEELHDFEQAIIRARRRYAKSQIMVITLPKKQYRNWAASKDTFQMLLDLGADIVTNTKLHAKLYISEPGPTGGVEYAILGSENLTGRKNVELAIQIENDNEILKKLREFFRNTREGAEDTLQIVDS